MLRVYGVPATSSPNVFKLSLFLMNVPLPLNISVTLERKLVSKNPFDFDNLNDSVRYCKLIAISDKVNYSYLFTIRMQR